MPGNTTTLTREAFDCATMNLHMNIEAIRDLQSKQFFAKENGDTKLYESLGELIKEYHSRTESVLEDTMKTLRKRCETLCLVIPSSFKFKYDSPEAEKQRRDERYLTCTSIKEDLKFEKMEEDGKLLRKSDAISEQIKKLTAEQNALRVAAGVKPSV